MSNHNAPVNKAHPDRRTVARIAAEEATAAGVAPCDVTGMGRSPKVWEARCRAWRRILRETRCSVDGLAAVWGCHSQSIRHALAAPKPPSTTYDASTVERLRWAHGEARASQIIAGTDPRTNADLQAWRRIIVHGEQP